MLGTLAAAGLLIATTAQPTSPASSTALAAITAPDVGFHAPQFDLLGLDGAHVRLQDFSGRFVVLNFFATWCEPCKREIPFLVQTSKTFVDKGVSIVGVDWNEPANLVSKFRINLGIGSYPVALDSFGDVYGAYNGTRVTIPQTYIIDPGGIVIYKNVGLLNVPRFLTALQSATLAHEGRASLDVGPQRRIVYDVTVTPGAGPSGAALYRGKAVVDLMGFQKDHVAVRLTLTSKPDGEDASFVGSVGPDGSLDFGQQHLGQVPLLLLPFFGRSFVHAPQWTLSTSVGDSVVAARYSLTTASAGAGINVQLNSLDSAQTAGGFSANGSVVYDMQGHMPRSGSLTLGPPRGSVAAPASQLSTLTFAIAAN